MENLIGGIIAIVMIVYLFYGSAASRKVLKHGVTLMNASGWVQLVFFSIVLLALTKPMGLYLLQVLDAEGKTVLDPALKPVERLIYRVAGIDPSKEQDWKGYAVSVLIFSFVTLLLTYIILRLQQVLPLNPQGLGGGFWRSGF